MQKLFLSLCLAFGFSLPVWAQVFPVDTILYNGDINNRINFVVLADGYQASELGKFKTDATNIFNYVFNTQPFKQYKNFFNVFIINVPSNESGAKHPENASDCGGSGVPVMNPDNYFGSAFDVGGTHRALTATNSVAIYSVLADNFPAYDQIIVLVNTPYYGGTGGDYSTVSTHSDSPEIMVHELGHSFGLLADTYESDGCPVIPGWMEAPNSTSETNPTLVPWKHWFDGATPLPTPAGQYCSKVGMHEGSSYCATGYYRSKCNDKMRTLGQPFDEPSIEQFILRIHEFTNNIESPVPAPSEPIEILTGGNDNLTFTTGIIFDAPSTIVPRWYLNNVPVAEYVSQYTLSTAGLPANSYQLKLIVSDTTPKVRKELTPDSVVWTINLRDPGLNARVFLEGAYSKADDVMRTDLQENELLSLNQPFNSINFGFYNGGETLATTSADVVDWVLVELRDTADISIIVAQKACLVLKDGLIVAADGFNRPTFNVSGSRYRVSFKHRNHLPIVSSAPVDIISNSSFDFSQLNAIGGGADFCSPLAANRYGMPAGDCQFDYFIVFDDFALWQQLNTAIYEYSPADLNLDGFVTVGDYLLWQRNNAKVSFLQN